MIWLQLFYVYLKIGIFGFGGGYAMLSLIQADVVDRYGWISSQEFTDIVAISQMTPRADRDQQRHLHRIYSHPQCRLFARDGRIRLLPDDICRLPALFPASAGHLIRLCKIQEQQICSSRVLRPSSGYGRPDCGSGFAIDE